MNNDDNRIILFIGMCKLVGHYIFIIFVGVYVYCYFISNDKINDLLFDMIFSISSCAHKETEFISIREV